MSAADRQKNLAMLAQSRQALLDSVAGVSEDHARIRPAPGRWSVLECVEHVALAEGGLLRFLTSPPASAAPPTVPSREEFFLRAAADRSNKVQAPDFVRPTGRFATLALALGEFERTRARTIRYIEQCPGDLRARSTLHPVVGPMNGQEMFILLALHPARHAAQILEVRASLPAA